jgi:threonyl-tRNA synthetase
MRFAELGMCHRNEASGTLQGLFRVRQFLQDDGHIFCSLDQVEEEVLRFVRFLFAIYRSFGFEHLSLALSLRPEPGDAEKILSRILSGAGFDFAYQPGEGAFYGPKIEFVLRDRALRPWQCGTIQLDMVLPERFDISYVDASGAKKRPVILHRAILGSFERFLAVMLEHHQGALPAWLAPEQVLVAPIASAHADYARRVADRFRARGLRVELDDRSESVSKKIAEAHRDGVPFLAIAGAKEAAAESISIRERDGSSRVLAIAEAEAELLRRCALELPSP